MTTVGETGRRQGAEEGVSVDKWVQFRVLRLEYHSFFLLPSFVFIALRTGS